MNFQEGMQSTEPSGLHVGKPGLGTECPHEGQHQWRHAGEWLLDLLLWDNAIKGLMAYLVSKLTQRDMATQRPGSALGHCQQPFSKAPSILKSKTGLPQERPPSQPPGHLQGDHLNCRAPLGCHKIGELCDRNQRVSVG